MSDRPASGAQAAPAAGPTFQSSVAFWSVIVIATLVRLAGCSSAGTGDLGAFMAGGAAFLDHGVRNYFVSSLPYPPFAPATLAVAEWLSRHVSPELPRQCAYNFLFNVALAGGLFLAYRLLRRERGEGAARLGVALIWAGPALVLNSPFLGYIDALFGTWVLLTFVAALSGRFGLAGILCGLALMTKPTAAVLLPVLAVLAWSRPDRTALVRAGLVTVYTILGCYLPYLLAGVDTLVKALQLNLWLLRVDHLSGNALNAWWVIQWLIQLLDRAPGTGVGEAMLACQTQRLPRLSFQEHFGFPYWVLSLTVVGLVTVLIAAWMIRRLRQPGASPLTIAFEAAAYQMLNYFTFGHAVHENHLALFFIFWPLAVVCQEGPRERRSALCIWGAFSALGIANLLAFYGLGQGRTSSAWLIELLRPAHGPDLTVLYSLILVASTLAVLVRGLRRATVP